MSGLEVCGPIKYTEKEKELMKLKFPNCIGMFPDKECQISTKDKPGKDCKLCPYFKK